MCRLALFLEAHFTGAMWGMLTRLTWNDALPVLQSSTRRLKMEGKMEGGKAHASWQETVAAHQKPGRRGPVWGGMPHSLHLPPRLKEATLSSGRRNSLAAAYLLSHLLIGAQRSARFTHGESPEVELERPVPAPLRSEAPQRHVQHEPAVGFAVFIHKLNPDWFLHIESRRSDPVLHLLFFCYIPPFFFGGGAGGQPWFSRFIRSPTSYDWSLARLYVSVPRRGPKCHSSNPVHRGLANTMVFPLPLRWFCASGNWCSPDFESSKMGFSWCLRRSSSSMMCTPAPFKLWNKNVYL